MIIEETQILNKGKPVVIVKNPLDGLVQPEHYYYPTRRVYFVAVEVLRRTNNEMPFGSPKSMVQMSDAAEDVGNLYLSLARDDTSQLYRVCGI
ncbi:hypothetical protein L3X38_038298 [Prunus dulcis]|nr:hypothetical protein L3X38_038298 [Prunus dulcis]